MYRQDLFGINNAFLKIINEDAGSLGPQAETQQGLSPVIQTVIKQKKEENCEDCGCSGSTDHDEIEMAKGELYDTIKHAVSLYKKISTTNNLEAWVRAKITKAADYLNSIKHYLDHEEIAHEQNEELDLVNAFDAGTQDVLSKITSYLSKESKENLEKVLFEVVQLIEKKS